MAVKQLACFVQRSDGRSCDYWTPKDVTEPSQQLACLVTHLMGHISQLIALNGYIERQERQHG